MIQAICHKQKESKFLRQVEVPWHESYEYFSRPLTAEQIKERREAARQRLAEKQNAANTPIVPTSTNTTLQPENGCDDTEEENPTEPQPYFVAFARVFSGTLRKGLKVYMLGPKHEPSQLDEVRYCFSC